MRSSTYTRASWTDSVQVKTMLGELNRPVCAIGPFYSVPDAGLKEEERQWRGGASSSVAHWPSGAGWEC